MWSGPRNISTAMLRAWENRPDTVVCDEPLYAYHLKRTGVQHPGVDEVLAEHNPPVDSREGLTLITSSIRRPPPDCLDPKIHHGNLIQSILAKIEASAASADEVFCSGTMGELASVTRIDGREIGDGRVGPLTTRLSRLFANLVAREGVPLVDPESGRALASVDD